MRAPLLSTRFLPIDVESIASMLRNVFSANASMSEGASQRVLVTIASGTTAEIRSISHQ